MPVLEHLDGRGFNVVIYEADKVADGLVPLDIEISNSTEFTARYDKRILDLGSVASAWYRRPTLFADEQDDRSLQLGLDTERRLIQYALWDKVPEVAWLSAPKRITHAEHKLTQLVMARDVGFDIPQTIASNMWRPIEDRLPEDIIFKPSYGMLYSNHGTKILYTKPFKNSSDDLPQEGIPFPGFWQPYLTKAREWRITAVGDQTFDAAIYTDITAKDDWRRHQLDSRVEFRAESFPDEQKEKCFDYLGRLGLGFGAFDFVEDDEGKITFLECNANGQYGWLEDDLGLPISHAIADELVRIAKK